jgi:hypothetical protein
LQTQARLSDLARFLHPLAAKCRELHRNDQ